MQRIGLAVSGGGFRAPVFHLGMIRRKADILPAVPLISRPFFGRSIRPGAERHCYPDSRCEFDANPQDLKGNP
jgi:hypothetical protein